MDAVEREVIAAREDDLLRAMRTRDADLLERLLHDDLLFVGPTGEVATKAMDLANYRSGGVHWRKVEVGERRINMMGDSAVVTVVVDLQGNYMGQAVDARCRYLRVWKQEGGSWRVIGGSVAVLERGG